MPHVHTQTVAEHGLKWSKLAAVIPVEYHLMQKMLQTALTDSSWQSCCIWLSSCSGHLFEDELQTLRANL